MIKNERGGLWRCVEVCGGVWRCVEVCANMTQGGTISVCDSEMWFEGQDVDSPSSVPGIVILFGRRFWYRYFC
jgi:hypothetical protein